jgi:hypothetical protein
VLHGLQLLLLQGLGRIFSPVGQFLFLFIFVNDTAGNLDYTESNDREMVNNKWEITWKLFNCKVLFRHFPGVIDESDEKTQDREYSG